MSKTKGIPEYAMVSEIRRRVKKADYPAPTVKQVEQYLRSARKNDPEAFGTDSSREVKVADISGLIVDRIKRARENQGLSRSRSGETTSYPIGYEYAVLTAQQIRSQIEDLRVAHWGSRSAPHSVLTVRHLIGFLRDKGRKVTVN